MPKVPGTTYSADGGTAVTSASTLPAYSKLYTYDLANNRTGFILTRDAGQIQNTTYIT